MALKKLDIDIEAIREQFIGLNDRHPGLWPILPKSLLLSGIFVLIVVFAWLFYWKGLVEELDAGRAREVQLKEQYRDKMRQAVNLEVLRKQKEQVAQYVSQLERQLPSKAEMDALLSDINQAGVGRGLQFELFKPGQVLVKEYYAELPIDIRLAGNYHDLGAFTSDLSNLARIVTLENIRIEENEKTGRLAMQAVAKTYRYLDQEEIAEQRRQAAEAAKAKGKAGGRK
jgi:type IV pilus assembly protein PilO